MLMQRGQECADWLARCQLSQKTVGVQMRGGEETEEQGQGKYGKEGKDGQSRHVMKINHLYSIQFECALFALEQKKRSVELR